ncbi:putative two-component regulator [Campylobacter sputorum subsp. bubulus]|uniref:Putative two-component regulator n=1 Tax=Campylobacter sputorum subsp. sputorum TaxID=32024 RepID=A0A381DJV7_9BACT|nr:response regulator [Campylobacter sputorum]ASM34324.1 two-component system response regulator [Campylobacter sputorum aubsp. sputorum RM3237]KAB0582283.1 response regulator transcription factor [Campylobacter sputorum subsp. sputorum]QEL04515.1 two-component system response regulator [Campylobacter sputorum subsp. sputorum]SUX09290.1 putative two-component regulator [Campylobacter sputorum subsp. bubulus]SUX10983.1 putative two-component regulator [Campylobacter sputorum subsp. sputorum]
MNNKFDVLKDRSIMVVDDDELTRMAVSGGLKRYCENFYTASDGLDGLEKFKKHRIDLIITDIHMPNFNGLDMMNEILKLKPDQTFIVVTSFDTDENLFESMKKGAISFIKKPIMMENLQNAVVMALFKIEDKVIKLNDCIIVNVTKEKIYKNGEEVYLSKLENAIFWLLCFNIENLVSYDMIEDFAYDGNSVKIGTIHTVIMRIKKQLNDINLSNISGSGYVLKKA